LLPLIRKRVLLRQEGANWWDYRERLPSWMLGACVAFVSLFGEFAIREPVVTPVRPANPRNIGTRRL
jgi:hypothetical protein